MRVPLSRVSPIIALAVVFTTLLALIAARDLLSRRDRNGVVRITRGGLQRLEAAEASSQDDSPDLSAARAPGDPTLSLDPPGADSAPMLAIIPAAAPVAGPPGDDRSLPHRSNLPDLVSRPHHPTLGRAPPTA